MADRCCCCRNKGKGGAGFHVPGFFRYGEDITVVLASNFPVDYRRKAKEEAV